MDQGEKRNKREWESSIKRSHCQTKEEGTGNLVLFEVLLLLFIAKLDQRYVYGISIFLISFRINSTDPKKKRGFTSLFV